MTYSNYIIWEGSIKTTTEIKMLQKRSFNKSFSELPQDELENELQSESNFVHVVKSLAFEIVFECMLSGGSLLSQRQSKEWCTF